MRHTSGLRCIRRHTSTFSRKRHRGNKPKRKESDWLRGHVAKRKRRTDSGIWLKKASGEDRRGRKRASGHRNGQRNGRNMSNCGTSLETLQNLLRQRFRGL